MSEFMIGVRKQFLQEDRKCVVVSHDWGALVCARLASEAGELADRWIITSGMIVSCQHSQVTTMVLISTASRNCEQRLLTMDFGASNAAHMDQPSLQYCPSQERSPGAQASDIAVQSLLLHLLLPPACASRLFLHVLWQLLVPAYHAQSWSRSTREGRQSSYQIGS